MIKNVSIQIYVFDTKKAWNRWLWKKTNLIVKEKCLREISIFQEMTKKIQDFEDPLTKITDKYLCIFLHLRTFRALFIFFPRKKIHFIRGQGVSSSPPPSLADMSAKNLKAQPSYSSEIWFQNKHLLLNGFHFSTAVKF